MSKILKLGTKMRVIDVDDKRERRMTQWVVRLLVCPGFQYEEETYIDIPEMTFDTEEAAKTFTAAFHKSNHVAMQQRNGKGRVFISIDMRYV